MVKAKELRECSTQELIEKLNEAENEYFRLKSEFELSRNLEKPHRLKLLKKDKARILTVMRAKELEAKAEGAKS